MTKTALNILITGFGAFPGVKENPTAFLIEQLQHTDITIVDNVEIHPHLLETAWQHAPQKLAMLYKTVQPDILLHFGFAQSAQGFCLEQYASNSTMQSLDYYGDLPPFHKVLTGEPPRLSSPYPTTQIMNYLHEGEFPAETSKDAGHYLCNMIYYLSCHFSQTERQRKVQSLFIHVPPIKLPSGKLIPPDSQTDDTLVLSHQQLITGVWHIIRYCRDFHIMGDNNAVMM